MFFCMTECMEVAHQPLPDQSKLKGITSLFEILIKTDIE